VGYHSINARLFEKSTEEVADEIAKMLGDPSDKLHLIWDGKRSAQKCKIDYV